MTAVWNWLGSDQATALAHISELISAPFILYLVWKWGRDA